MANLQNAYNNITAPYPDFGGMLKERLMKADENWTGFELNEEPNDIYRDMKSDACSKWADCQSISELKAANIAAHEAAENEKKRKLVSRETFDFSSARGDIDLDSLGRR